jgi:succinoglycan biosynthesis transport protein ExoP
MIRHPRKESCVTMADGRPSQIDDVELDMRALLGTLLRASPWLALSGLVFASALYIGLNFVAPRYQAETKILIENGESEITRGGESAGGVRALVDAEAVASQVQLITSRDLATKVVSYLGLASLPEFNKPRLMPSLDQMLVSLGLGRPTPQPSADSRVLQRFAERLDVFSIDKTRVITVAFTSTNPEIAAQVANAVATEYLALEREARRSTNADATRWLEAQIAELRERVTEAEARVEAFRTEHGLFTGGGQNDTSLAQQKLNDLNAELSRLVAARSAAEAKAESVRKSLANGGTPDLPDVRDSQLIQRLREQQVGLRAQAAHLSASLLPGHPRIKELNAQLSDLDAQVRREVTRILQSLEGEAVTARARETDIGRDIARARAATGVNNDADVQLRALEREATAQRDLLESYLRRYREASSRQDGNYLPADARIISKAAVPLEPVFPNKLPLTAAATVALLLLAIAIIVIRELTSGRALRRFSLEAPLAPAASVIGDRPRGGDDHPIAPSLSDPLTPSRGLPSDVEGSLDGIVDRLVQTGARRVLVAMVEGEEKAGRPLAAVSLARALSLRGDRVLLVDLHSDGADGKAMALEDGTAGITDLFAGQASFTDVIFRDRHSRAHLIPHGSTGFEIGAMGDERFVAILDALDQTYDHILLDADLDAGLQLAGRAGAVVVVSDRDATDPRTVQAVEAMKVATDADVVVLIADAPLTEAEDPQSGELV